MKASRRWNHGTLAPLRWMRQPEPFLLQGKGVPIIIIFIILPYSLYAQERPVLLSVSAWNHTHGARYQNRTGTYCLEGSRSAINLIRRMPPSFRCVICLYFAECGCKNGTGAGTYSCKLSACFVWWRGRDSNTHLSDHESEALPLSYPAVCGTDAVGGPTPVPYEK